MNEFEKLNEIFQVSPFKEEKPVVKKSPETSEDKTESDFDLSRETLRNLIDKNNQVIDEIISIARASETARPFEVVGQLVKTQSEIAKDLLELHKQKKDIKSEDPKSIKQQNNIVFNGSTNELMRLLNGKDTIDVDPKE